MTMEATGKGLLAIQGLDGYPSRRRPTRPREVPQVRMELVADATRLAPALAAMPWVHNRAEGALHRRDFDRVEYLIDSVVRSSLWFVEPEMCALLAHAWPTLPATTLTEELAPLAEGVIFYAVPIEGQDADGPGTVTVHAMSWMDVHLTELGGLHAIGIIPWQCIGPTWSPMGRTDWPYGEDTDTGTTVLDGSAQRLASQSEDRRMLAALWLLASQQRVAEVTSAAVTNKGARRRYEREYHRRPPQVHVIDVRRPEDNRAGGGGSHDVEWTRRWIVSGHWRQQAYGTGRQLRRPTWIDPFVKGPADKPLVITERVRDLR